MKRSFSMFYRNSWITRTVFFSALLASCVIAFMPTEGTMQEQINDKLAHCLSFFLLSCLFQLAYPRIGLLKVFLYMALFGLGIECVQAYLPHRSFELLDWGADALGSAIYLLGLAPLIRRQI